VWQTGRVIPACLFFETSRRPPLVRGRPVVSKSEPEFERAWRHGRARRARGRVGLDALERSSGFRGALIPPLPKRSSRFQATSWQDVPFSPSAAFRRLAVWTTNRLCARIQSPTSIRTRSRPRPLKRRNPRVRLGIREPQLNRLAPLHVDRLRLVCLHLRLMGSDQFLTFIPFDRPAVCSPQAPSGQGAALTVFLRTTI
jgi:hypothetical protein